MARSTGNQEFVERFHRFYRHYCDDDIADLAQHYPSDRRSLYVDYDDLYRFDGDLAEDVRAQPDQLREYAEEALRQYDLPVDVKLGRAHVRIRNLPDTVDIRGIRVHDDHIGRLVAVQGIVRKATDVRPKITEAAFECQRCGTMTYIPQTDGSFQEPHECQGCERQGPFRVNFDQSEFVDSQKLRVQESPEGLRGGETPQSIDVNIEDDVTGEVTAGDHVTVTGVLHIEQMGSQGEKSPVFDLYMDGVAVEVEDEEFENMDIDEDDVADILELSEAPDIYERMVDSIAPTIYGYEKEKLAMALQLFSGVTKHLPDGSRLRGDLHMLLIGDPGTGKCVDGDTMVSLADGARVPIRDLVESNLDDPKPVDDGVWDDAGVELLSLTDDGRIDRRKATKVWKREAPETMLRVRTTSGRELDVTPSHPLFVRSGAGVSAQRADALSEGAVVATPRRLPGDGDDTLDVTVRRSKSPNAGRLDLPDVWTPWLGRLLGYVVAEGYVERREDNTGYVSVTNNDREILDDVGDAFDRLGLNYFERDSHPEKDAREVVCASGEFVSFLANLDASVLGGSQAQRVPGEVMTASRTTKRSFLRAFVDAEGHVSTTQRELTVASTSRRLLDEVRHLLLGFDVRSQRHPRRNGSYRLRISGADFARYVEQIGFVTERKTAASEAFPDCSENTNTDVVPVLAEDLRRIREALALSQSDCGVPRTTYQHYERGDRTPSRSSLNRVVEAFEERIAWLRNANSRIETWDDVISVRDELNVPPAALAEGLGVDQTAVSYYERNDAIPDGGVNGARAVVNDRIDRALDVAPDVDTLRALVENDLSWDRIESIEAVTPDEEWVYDLEVAGTHSYVSNGVVSHNSQLLSYIRNVAPRSVYTSGKGSSAAGLTAAAVRDDFGDGQQWTLEAGALVLADKGIAAIDELDKMNPDDRSAMHQGLEQQEISISKAGINATLKSRCSLLGAANPKHGRFDQYEPIGEQIDLEPALISRFDLIFTVTDQPDPDEDARLAEHILDTNYAGELRTQRAELSNAEATPEEVEQASGEVQPAIDPDLFRKYIAYAKRSCFPRMTDEAKETIRDFYVDMRSRGIDEDSPVPITARKIEALVRLSEASARVRLSDTVETEDAERVVDIVRSSMEDIGVDPETGQFDADVIETGTSKSQRDRIKNLKELIQEIEDEYEEGAPVEQVLERAAEVGMDPAKAEGEIENLKKKGEVYEPSLDHLRTT